MLVISLTSIPPRFSQLPSVLSALRMQGADQIALVIPDQYRRFGIATLPALPEGVALLRTEADIGPAGKYLVPAATYPDADILYCDDDWLYHPGWADTFIRERNKGSAGQVVAASIWSTERIGRSGGRIAQGFAGVLVPSGTAAAIPHPPPAAWAVDDIWLSGCFAAQGVAIVENPAARRLCSPLESPGALQDDNSRDIANRAAAASIHGRFGIWPAV